MKTIYSVYTAYPDGKRVELRQFPNKARAVGYAKECAAHEEQNADGRCTFAVAKVEIVAVFGE